MTAAAVAFTPALVPGRLERRYKRFLADVTLNDGSCVTAHCPNPGAMTGLAAPGSAVWLAPVVNPKAKLRWRWIIATQEGVMTGIDTLLANRLAFRLLEAGAVPELAGHPAPRREVATGGGSRIDLLLSGEGSRPDCWVEVKSVTLRRPDGPDPLAAEFPDAVTTRGARHLDALAELARGGARAAMLYLVQRDDCRRFRIAADIDPAYAGAFARARAAGVEMLCYDCAVSPAGVRVGKPLPLAGPGSGACKEGSS